MIKHGIAGSVFLDGHSSSEGESMVEHNNSSEAEMRGHSMRESDCACREGELDSLETVSFLTRESEGAGYTQGMQGRDRGSEGAGYTEGMQGRDRGSEGAGYTQGMQGRDRGSGSDAPPKGNKINESTEATAASATGGQDGKAGQGNHNRKRVMEKNRCSSASSLHHLLPPQPPKLTPVMLVLLVVVLYFCHTLAPASAAPFQPSDNFTPACNGLLRDPPPRGWKLWSSKATWGGGPVPGIGSRIGANVTIPCGMGVLLDLPRVQLTVLDIQGALKLKDHPSLPLVAIFSAFIIVEGRFIIGSATRQFGHRAEITLIPNPNGRANYSYTSRPPADTTFGRNLGHKAFAVVGGQVDFHGIPGPARMQVWSKLVANAKKGVASIDVSGDVSSWPIGSLLVVAPTDYYADQDDVASIRSVRCGHGRTWCRVYLSQRLKYNHFGNPRGVSDGFGGFINEAAEVALLRRNIVITGTDGAAPYDLEGGHFIVFMTNTPQIIEGVEFLRMGQQGRLGRYPLHFHLCGDQRKKSLIRKNLIRNSKQRCLVIHATFNAMVDSNVAYNTTGHCFIIEEGSETGNTFAHNLGIRMLTPKVKISPDETDDKPSTFWITNLNNNYIGNAAAGSDDTGIWIELRPQVRGLSAMWSKVNKTLPLFSSTIGKFIGNSAHSNAYGLRTYPHGMVPRLNASAGGSSFYDYPAWIEFGQFILWKNNLMGAFLHGMDHVVFSHNAIADNPTGIHMAAQQGVQVQSTRFVGLSGNTGNPTNCEEVYGNGTCWPVTGCQFPLAPGAPGRSLPSGGPTRSLVGVLFDQARETEDGSQANLLQGCTFAGFDPACRVSAAIAVGRNRESYWNTGTAIQGVKFASSPVTNKVYMFSAGYFDPYQTVDKNENEAAKMYALRDVDGSVIGSPGFIIANNSPYLLPPSSSKLKCRRLPLANGLACPRTCYRTLQITYDEPGFKPYPSSAPYDGVQPLIPRKLGDYSYVQVTRVSTKQTISLEGNLIQAKSFQNYADSTRFFPVSLLTGYEYLISIMPPLKYPGFLPNSISVEFMDGGGCGQGITLRMKGSKPGNYYWAVNSSELTTWAPCPSSDQVLTTSVAPARHRYSCDSTSSPPSQYLELNLTPSLPPARAIQLTPIPGVSPGCTRTQTRCGLTATRSVWEYNQMGTQDLHPAYPGGPAFYNPIFPTPSPAWQKGQGVLSYIGRTLPDGRISTYLAAPVPIKRTTYYFRTTFLVQKSACYSTLYLELVALHGVVVYLNNKEILRFNMPPGTPNLSTLSTKPSPGFVNNEYIYFPFSLPLTGKAANSSLVEGRNYLAAEYHMNFQWGPNIAFAMRTSALLDPTCNRAQVLPEVCDGLDNNHDGKVDIDPRTKKALRRPCRTACGAGYQTCARGAYQPCITGRCKKKK